MAVVLLACLVVAFGGEVSLAATPPSPGEQERSVMPVSEKFKLAHESFVGTFKAYTANVIQTAGFILLTLGWFITSDKARAFIGSRRVMRRLALAAVALVLLIHLLVSWGYRLLAERQFERLAALKFVEESFFEDSRITVVIFVVNAALNCALFGVLFLVIWHSARAQSPADP